MKKLHLLIVMLLAIVAFAAADYYVNARSISLTQTSATETPEDPYPNLVQSLLDVNPIGFNYQITKRNRTKHIFEKFDLSSLTKVRIYRNYLEESGSESESTTLSFPLVIYEIQGPANQGGLSYLNLKLKIIDQMDATGNLNEVSQYGYNSFFYNNINYPDTGFLMTQIKDNLFGFQYNKQNSDSFDIVKKMINSLVDLTIIQ